MTASSGSLHLARRKAANSAMWAGCILATFLAIVPLALVLGYLVKHGLPMLNRSFFTEVQPDFGSTGGGMKHAIAGSLLLIGLASCIGLPFGIMGGIYLAEFGNNRFGFCVRFAADVLNGVPSIVIGIFINAIAVLPAHPFLPFFPAKQYSALAGGLALGMMMVPTIMRTTEEIVKLVPMSLREASLALGATRSRTTLKVVLGAAKGGVITGVLLAIARISGETAPLLFTVLGNNFWSVDPRKPIAALPLTIYQFATSADNHWNDLAWGGALVLVSLVFVLSLAARFFTRGQFKAVK